MRHARWHLSARSHCRTWERPGQLGGVWLRNTKSALALLGSKCAVWFACEGLSAELRCGHWGADTSCILVLLLASLSWRLESLQPPDPGWGRGVIMQELRRSGLGGSREAGRLVGSLGARPGPSGCPLPWSSVQLPPSSGLGFVSFSLVPKQTPSAGEPLADGTAATRNAERDRVPETLGLRVRSSCPHVRVDGSGPCFSHVTAPPSVPHGGAAFFSFPVLSGLGRGPVCPADHLPL